MPEPGDPALDAEDLEVFAGSNVDVRTVLHFRVADETASRLLPAGWVLDPPCSGAAAGANLRLTFIDTIAAFTATGAPRAAVCYVLLGLPARRSEATDAGLMLVTGLSPGGAGPYQTNMLATAKVERTIFRAPEGSLTREVWTFEGRSASVRLRLDFMPSTAIRDQGELRVFSGITPSFSRLYRYEQFVDVVHAGAAERQGLATFHFDANGPGFSDMFDGGEHLVSVLSIPSYSRKVFGRRSS